MKTQMADKLIEQELTEEQYTSIPEDATELIKNLLDLKYMAQLLKRKIEAWEDVSNLSIHQRTASEDLDNVVGNIGGAKAQVKRALETVMSLGEGPLPVDERRIRVRDK